MPERPRLSGTGVIRTERTPGRLYEVEMPNGFRSLAVVPREGPACPKEKDPIGAAVTTAYSPYDMSRCRIVEWLID